MQENNHNGLRNIALRFLKVVYIISLILLFGGALIAAWPQPAYISSFNSSFNTPAKPFDWLLFLLISVIGIFIIEIIRFIANYIFVGSKQSFVPVVLLGIMSTLLIIVAVNNGSRVQSLATIPNAPSTATSTTASPVPTANPTSTPTPTMSTPMVKHTELRIIDKKIDNNEIAQELGNSLVLTVENTLDKPLYNVQCNNCQIKNSNGITIATPTISRIGGATPNLLPSSTQTEIQPNEKLDITLGDVYLMTDQFDLNSSVFHITANYNN